MSCGILVPQPGIETVTPAVEAQSPNHWTAREEFPLFLKNNIKSDSVVFLKELGRNSFSISFFVCSFVFTPLSPCWSHIELPSSPNPGNSGKGSRLQAGVAAHRERLDVLASAVPLATARRLWLTAQSPAWGPHRHPVTLGSGRESNTGPKVVRARHLSIPQG